MKQQDLRSDLLLVSLQSLNQLLVLKLQCHELNGHVTCVAKIGLFKATGFGPTWLICECRSPSFEAHLCLGTWSSPSLNLEFLVVLHQYHLNRGSPTSTKTLNVIPAVRYASLGITVWSSRRWSRALGRVKHLNSLELGILAALAMQFRSGQIMLKFTKPTVHGRNPKQPPGM